jgi:histidinol-phosphate aminotransferase
LGPVESGQGSEEKQPEGVDMTASLSDFRFDNATCYASTRPARYDLGLSANPLGCSPTLDARFATLAVRLGYQPSAYPRLEGLLRAALARFYRIKAERLYIDPNGASGAIASLFDVGIVEAGATLVVPEAGFPVPVARARAKGIKVASAPMTPAFHIDFDALKKTAFAVLSQGERLGGFFLCNPNNPTGYAEASTLLIDLAKTFPDAPVIVSEANMELVNAAAYRRIGGALLDPRYRGDLPSNLLVVRSFSKAYGLANDRLGYVVAAPVFIQALANKNLPFALGDRQTLRACLALEDQEHVAKSRAFMAAETAKMVKALCDLGFHHVSNSDANLILAGVPDCFEGGSTHLVQDLRARDCAVVNCGLEFGPTLAGRFVRLTPSCAQNNERFLALLRDVCLTQRIKRLPFADAPFDGSSVPDTRLRRALIATPPVGDERSCHRDVGAANR